MIYPKLLAKATISATGITPLYNNLGGGSSVPLRSAFVKNILLTNNGGSSVTLNLYVSPANGSDSTATKYRIAPKDVTIPAGNQLVVDNEITLERRNIATPPTVDIRGDILSIDVSTASPSVDVVVNGVETDV
jgi:hypothetical protein